METQNTVPARPNKVLKWLLVLGIMIVLNLFFVYGIAVFYKAPVFEDFCPVSQVTQTPSTQAECTAQGGGWTQYAAPVAVPGGSAAKIAPALSAGYCNVDFTCQNQFTDASNVYNRNVFVILVILGVASLVAGFFISASSAVSLGLSLGGVLALVVGSVRYWSDMNDYLRFGVLAVALAILIWVGVKKIKN